MQRHERVTSGPVRGEFRHPDGMLIRFRRGPVEHKWDEFITPGTISYEEAQRAAAEVLSGKFVQETIRGIKGEGPQSKREDVSTADVMLVQQGLKNGIFKVDANEHQFVLVLARGPHLNEETVNDSLDLYDLHELLAQHGLPIFVPKSFVVEDETPITGFSVEYLADHVEVNSIPNIRLIPKDISYTVFTMNTDVPKAHRYQARMVEAKKYIYDPRIANPNNEYIKTANRIKIEMIARLAIICRLTGCFPRQFSVNAGDFMADPDREDFDLRLITIRGGWQPVRDEEEFVTWFYHHRENATIQQEGHTISSLSYPLFDGNLAIIDEGLKRAEEIFTSSSQNDRQRPGGGRR